MPWNLKQYVSEIIPTGEEAAPAAIPTGEAAAPAVEEAAPAAEKRGRETKKRPAAGPFMARLYRDDQRQSL